MNNRGLDWDRELREQDGSEHQFGATSQPGLANIPTELREKYLPAGELQFGKEDFMDCATRAPINDLEMQLTYLFQTGQLRQENKLWLESCGYVEDNRIKLSDRFNAIRSGTTRTGNSLKAPIDSIHRDGVIPKKMLPRAADMTWDQYHSGVTKEMLYQGLEFLKRFSINYEQVQEIHYGELLKDEALVVAGHAWPKPINGVYPSPGAAQSNHAFLAYRLPRYSIFDNYEESQGDFIKQLAPDYNLYDYGYRVFISAERIPDIEQTVLEVLTKYNLLQYFADWLKRFNAPPLAIVEPNKKKELLQDMCLEIKTHEGWYIGSRSWRNNNPGNCRYSSVGYLPKYGVVKKDKQNFAIFQDYATGYLYLQNLILWKAAQRPNDNLYQFFAVYAPAFENDTKRYAELVAHAMGVSPLTFKMKELL